ncbi:MAG TPA: EpsI family protein [Albitalea sp.]|uniref:exosortase C-terminal domain/associated protein EpsI n=1 Tax=Piscinibacter sp. TaxID=1903157 RepID=UPI002ED45F0D
MSAMPNRRKAIVFAATLATSVVLAEAARPRRRDDARAKQPLADIFLRQFGDWRADDTAQAFVQPPDDQGKVYGFYDQVLQRAYLNPQGERIMLCVAYGSEQSPALQVHRPEICYASSGFRVGPTRKTTIAVGAHTLPATQLHAVMVGRSEAVTYWTVLGDEVVGDGSSFRWRQLASGLRGEVRDGMLVRVSSLGQDVDAGYRLHERFARELLQGVPARHHARVFGAPNAA